MLLPDVNIWLALTFSSHDHHPIAKNWFESLSTGPCHFCRMTQQGFLRLASNPKVFGSSALTLADAWNAYDVVQCDPLIAYHEEPAGIEAAWRNLTNAHTFAPHVWNDAYLAAFALTAGLQIVTFDKGFSKFAGLTCTILS